MLVMYKYLHKKKVLAIEEFFFYCSKDSKIRSKVYN